MQANASAVREAAVHTLLSNGAEPTTTSPLNRMPSVARFLILVLLAAPGPLAAQEAGVGFRQPAPSVGVFAGLGSGPIDAATWGLAVGIPIWEYFSVRAEYSGWGNGLAGTMCVAMPPDSHRCSVSGRAGLVGIAASIPVEGPLGVFAEVSGGRFTRDWLGDDTVGSAALSMEAGARVRLLGGLSGRLGGRFLRAFDDQYHALLGERLQYTMGIVGLEYGIGR